MKSRFFFFLKPSGQYDSRTMLERDTSKHNKKVSITFSRRDGQTHVRTSVFKCINWQSQYCLVGSTVDQRPNTKRIATGSVTWSDSLLDTV
jgi:hypothetical protein